MHTFINYLIVKKEITHFDELRPKCRIHVRLHYLPVTRKKSLYRYEKNYNRHKHNQIDRSCLQ